MPNLLCSNIYYSRHIMYTISSQLPLRHILTTVCNSFCLQILYNNLHFLLAFNKGNCFYSSSFFHIYKFSSFISNTDNFLLSYLLYCHIIPLQLYSATISKDNIIHLTNCIIVFSLTRIYFMTKFMPIRISTAINITHIRLDKTQFFPMNETKMLQEAPLFIHQSSLYCSQPCCSHMVI